MFNRVFIKYCVISKDFRTFWTLVVLCFPLVSVCVHTPGRQNSSAAAELEESRKITKSKGKNTIFYEHPVPGLRIQSTFGRTACSCSLSRPPHHISKPSIDWLRPLTSEKAFLSSMPITSMSLSAKPPIVFAIGCQWQSHHNIFYIPSLKVLTSQSSGRLLNDACQCSSLHILFISSGRFSYNALTSAHAFIFLISLMSLPTNPPGGCIPFAAGGRLFHLVEYFQAFGKS